MVGHFDVDAFYASVAIRDDPTLRGKPVAVAGNSRRAVVLTASYEARPFGVRSAMPLYRALQVCPQLVVVAPNHSRYREVSREIFTVFAQDSRAVEGLSLDEAFVDLAACDFDAALSAAAMIRATIRERTGLTVSGGVATGKMIAKIASDLCKPDGLRAIAPGEEAAFLAPLPVGKLGGVGPKSQSRLSARGIATIGQLAELNDATLHAIFGSSGLELRELARGRDERRVQPDRETKSISTEETFEYDVADEYILLNLLREQAAELAGKLQSQGLRASTVGIKIKRHDFSVVVRQTHLSEPAMDERAIYAASAHCLVRAELQATRVRLLGTRVASLVACSSLQMSLFQ
ncbi:MAG: DNA polymerase IV [Candidatus Eremiobacteraeota bacterium]|nr:DNA polymerase IV [Candidatus Eremiobacteraeota bacterium]